MAAMAAVRRKALFQPARSTTHAVIDRPDDARDIAERILDADPGARGARSGEHLRDGVKVDRQRRAGRARNAQQNADRRGRLREGETENRDGRQRPG